MISTLIRDPEMTDHDREARRLSDKTLIAAALDLNRRKVWDKKDPESRWVLGRRAALLREINRRRLTEKDA
jgi:cobalamin biosynthesis Mg chelatase CobN